jgi:hypothetical protein
MLVEEVLRLTTLPGEDQGRIYCIRRLRLPPLDPADAAPGWQRRCATHLLTIADQAVRAVDAGSERADTVFFADAHEPYREAVNRLLRGNRAREWFWARATGVAIDLEPPIRLQLLIDRWRRQPAGWAGVARELLPALNPRMAHVLLQAIAPETAAAWVGCDPPGRSADDGAPPIRAHTRRLLQDARSRFSVGDSRVLFLAVLAVLESSPAIGDRAALAALAESVLENVPVEPRPAVTTAPHAIPAHASEALPADPPPQTAPLLEGRTTSESGATQRRMTTDSLARPSSAPDVDWPTEYAGVYFALHVLRHLGIAAVLEEHPRLAISQLVPRILLRVAMRAGVGRHDPILRPLVEDAEGAPLANEEPVVVPRTLSHLHRLRATPDLNERLWACAVRRWCWRVARISTADMLRRPGRIRATPASIDVTLPMATVNLALRRAGLDIDPAYVPWFGRLVHFHYYGEGRP